MVNRPAALIIDLYCQWLFLYVKGINSFGVTAQFLILLNLPISIVSYRFIPSH